ncbi:head-tail connector protein [Azonexus sp. IMCC34839]|uniref:head-tail connector protein n=1 Tax=Azonexus sp. IMCC34839 TaxID=3133695 RepID=UPI00399BF69D
MSLLDDVKADLRIDDDDSDDHLVSMIEEIKSECLASFDYPEGFDPELSPRARRGIRLLVQQDFEGDPYSRDTVLAQARAIWRLDAILGA